MLQNRKLQAKKASKSLVKAILIIASAYFLIYLAYLVFSHALAAHPLLILPAFPIAAAILLKLIKHYTGLEFQASVFIIGKL